MIKHKKGFTLIELLIVVAIIGILAVALVPTISDAPSRARDAARKTLVNNVITAIESYNIDKGGYPVYTGCLNAAAAASDSATAQYKLINEYLGGKAPVSTVIPVETDTTATTNCAGAVFYDGTASGYTVGIGLEGKGTIKAGSADADPGYFVVVRN